jgi:2-polyprenyl-6-hydroxyphenyl methylase/3-demethylubiquinone-9 3-methyltransferase
MSMNNIDPSEIAKFTEISAHWWDPRGDLKTLHEINPLRLKWINDKCPLAEKSVIDVGCGGGILTESIAKLGGHVTGIDMSQGAINVANLHQMESGVQVEYLLTTAEKMAENRPGNYDVVTCMEMLEHVPDPAAVVKACATLAKPNGDIFFSTLNRNVKSYLFAIIGAEYILKLLPQNTHDFAKFIRPSELSEWSRVAGLTPMDMAGYHYNLFTKKYSLNNDISVNYIVHLKKSGQANA